MVGGSNTGARLLALIERIERFEEEVAAAKAEIVEVKREARSAGFDVRAIGQMIRERRLSSLARLEWQTLCETYRAALGMLDGTPLGDAAQKRLTPPNPDSKPDRKQDPDRPPGDGPSDPDEQDGPGDMFDAPSPPDEPAATSAEDIEGARDEGDAAQRRGDRVTDNPHGFADPRRAAWDEGWCRAAGSDGMEMPPAWRRATPPKPRKGPDKSDRDPADPDDKETSP